MHQENKKMNSNILIMHLKKYFKIIEIIFFSYKKNNAHKVIAMSGKLDL
jgi:hypothetical protein